MDWGKIEIFNRSFDVGRIMYDTAEKADYTAILVGWQMEPLSKERKNKNIRIIRFRRADEK